MDKFDLGIMILTGISVLSLVALIVLQLDTATFLPITSALVGYVIGRKKDVVMGAFRK